MNTVSQIAKVKLKVGSMELEYEGDPSFLTGGIEALLMTMGGLAAKVTGETLPPEPTVQVPPTNGNGTSSSNGLSFSTNTIAARLNAKSGPELVICALAQLELVQRKSSSTRTEIIDEMKGATTYYNENMRGNMTKNLGNLTKAKRINQIAKDTYALSATERKQIEVKVVEIG